MKHNLLLPIIIILTSSISGMEFTYSSLFVPKRKHRKKTTITIPDQTNNNHDICIQLDHNGTFKMNTKRKRLHKSSHKKHTPERFERV